MSHNSFNDSSDRLFIGPPSRSLGNYFGCFDAYYLRASVACEGKPHMISIAPLGFSTSHSSHCIHDPDTPFESRLCSQFLGRAERDFFVLQIFAWRHQISVAESHLPQNTLFSPILPFYGPTTQSSRSVFCRDCTCALRNSAEKLCRSAWLPLLHCQSLYHTANHLKSASISPSPWLISTLSKNCGRIDLRKCLCTRCPKTACIAPSNLCITSQGRARGCFIVRLCCTQPYARYNP